MRPPTEERLRAAWTALASEVGAPMPAAERVRADLEARYREPGRAYHTLEHVADVLGWLDHIVSAGQRVEDLWALHAAAWFHDAVYDASASVGPGGNEEASARLASTVLAGWGVPGSRRERVEALVRLTAHHDPDRAGDDLPRSDAAVLADADLAVLAAPASRYDAYARAVRREYAHLDEEAFRRGRRAFVEAMLARPRLYHTSPMAALEAAARRNLGRERAAL